jgi:hypothetical protein
MSEHFCEYDHNLDEPCDKPVVIKVIGVWLCAEHYDEHARFMAGFGRTPENEELQ